MSRKVWFFFLLPLLIVGCDHTRSATVQSNGSLPTFEISNVTINRQPEDNSSWGYDIKGIIATKDAELSQGMVVVYLETLADPKPKSGFWGTNWKLSIYLENGIGAIDTGTYYYKTDYKENPGPPKVTWKIVGYTKLLPAELQQPH